MAEHGEPKDAEAIDASLNQRLSAFLPTWLVQRIAADHSELTSSASESWRGTLLQVDVTGFTQLTEQWASLGDDGAEKISRVLNHYFGRLIDIIISHGGDIVSFAGDAVLAVWRARFTSPAETALAATRGALEVRRQMPTVDPGVDALLSLRSALVSGELQALLLGGQLGRWESVVVGDPIRQLGKLIARCEDGGVALSEDTYQLVFGGVNATSTGIGWQAESMVDPGLPLPIPRPLLSDSAATTMRRWVPGVILSRVAAGQTAWLSELRHVAVAFIGLPVEQARLSDVDLRALQEVVLTLQRCVYRFDGSVNKISTDEKGATLVAVFGLPPLSHEDDPLRCVRSALMMARKLDGRIARLPIGIATGRVFCGVMGNDSRCEYTVMGSVVNLSARLMALAFDRILCDHETARSTRHAMIFEDPNELKIKGFDRKVRAYQPTGATRAVLRSKANIVGRTREREVLSKHVQRLVREQVASVVVLRGEPGIGKSRLTEELVQQARTLGVRVMHAGADPLESSTAYHVWRPIVAALLGLDPQDAQKRLRELVRAGLGALDDNAVERAPLLNALLPLDLPDTDTTRNMVGQSRAASTQLLVAGLVQRAADERPILLVLEDGHWFDSATWALLQLVVSEVSPLLVALITRPIAEGGPDEYRWLLAQAETTELDLQQLSKEDILSLACQRLGIRELPPEAAAVVTQRTDGNPMFVEELAFALRDSGALAIDGEECRLAVAPDELASINLPSTVQGLIISRFDRLGEVEQVVLKVASVIGRLFGERVLHDVYPNNDRVVVVKLLPELVRTDLIREEITAAVRSFLFRHALTHEAVYGLILFSQRRGLHREVAVWYEQQLGNQLDQHYGLVALHYTRAHDWKPAAVYTAKAADQALERYSNREAVALFEQLLVAVDEHGLTATADQRMRWHLQLAEARFRIGDIAGCRKDGLLAMRLSGNPVPTTIPGQLLGILRGVGMRVMQRWLPTLFQVVKVDERQRRLALTRVLNRLTEVAIYGEDALSCLDVGLRDLNTAEPSGPSPELGQAYAVMAVVLGTIPLHRISRAWTARALQVSEPSGHTVELAYALSRVGVYEIYIADWTSAEQHLQRAIDIATQLGDRRLREEAMVVQGLSLYYSGHLDQPLALWEQTRQSARFSANDQTLSWTHIADAGALIRLGRPADAKTSLGEILEWVDTHGTRTEKILGHGLLSLALLRTGDLERAQDQADTALDLISGNPPVAYWMQHAVAAVCQTYLALWRAALDSHNKQAAKLMRRRSRKALFGMRWFAFVFPFGRAHAALWAGHHAWLDSAHSAARRHWRKAIERADTYELPFERALANRALGASEQGDVRTEYILRAGDELEQMRAAHDLAVARRMLKSDQGPTP